MGEREELEKAIGELEGLAAGGKAAETLRTRLLAIEEVRQSGERRGAVTALYVRVFSGPAAAAPPEGGEALGRIVTEHGGAVSWRSGGRLMALWGTDTPRRSDPEQALKAALEIREALRGEAGEAAPPRVRMGLGTGPAMVGPRDPAGGRPAAGDCADLAISLEEAAGPGEILLSESTYRYVRGVFDVTPAESAKIPRRRAPLSVYKLLRAKTRAFQIPIRGVGDIETSTVGREEEIQALKDCYFEASEGARTRLVLVTGEAGVGKSRLLYEFQKWLELRPEIIRLFESHAVPETARRPNGAIRDLFSFRFEIRDSDNVERVRGKFRKGLDGLLDRDRADVVGHWLGFDFSGSPAVRGLLGSRSFRQQAQADLFHVFRSLGERPAVLFLEDLHWADDGSLDLLEQLAGEVPDRRLLFVCLARPALLKRRPDWGSGIRSLTRVDLGPLTEDQSRTLVEEILQRADDVPESLRELVVRGAQGNPFYVEELILLLIDRGVITTGEEVWRVDRDKLSGIRLPRTLNGVLRARLDCLPSRERLLLQRASVVGSQFWDAAVNELSAEDEGNGGGAAQTRGLLETANERQLIFSTGTSSFEGAQEYQFKHAILRDIVYGSVLQKARRAYHSGVARWLERSLEDRQSEYLSVIAEHCEAAGESDRAASYLVRAGAEMAKVSAFRDAVATFRRALALLPRGDAARASTLACLGDAMRQLGDFDEARRQLEEAVEFARSTGDTRTEMAALNALARAEMIQGAYADAKPHLAEALMLASRHGYQDGAAQVLLNLADVSFRLGDAETASESGMQSLQISTELGDAQGIAGAHRVLGFACMMRGKNEDAARHHEQGLEIFRSVGDRWGEATCLVNLGEVHRKMGKIDEAVGFWRRSLPIYQEIGSRHGVAIAHLNTGGALAGKPGREDQALMNLKRALNEALAIGAMPIVLEGLVCTAILFAREGRQPVAARLLGTAVNHPSFNAEIQEYSEPLIRQLRKKLGDETLRSLLDQGRSMELSAVVKEIVEEPGPQGGL